MAGLPRGQLDTTPLPSTCTWVSNTDETGVRVGVRNAFPRHENSDEGPGRCPNRLKFSQGQHMPVFFMAPQSNTAACTRRKVTPRPAQGPRAQMCGRLGRPVEAAGTGTWVFKSTPPPTARQGGSLRVGAGFLSVPWASDAHRAHVPWSLKAPSIDRPVPATYTLATGLTPARATTLPVPPALVVSNPTVPANWPGAPHVAPT